MEIVLLVALVGLAGWWFFLREKKEDFKAPEAPYKVEAPVVAEKSPDDRVEATAPVQEAPVVAAAPQSDVKKKTKPKAAKSVATKTKPAVKTTPRVKKTK